MAPAAGARRRRDDEVADAEIVDEPDEQTGVTDGRGRDLDPAGGVDDDGRRRHRAGRRGRALESRPRRGCCGERDELLDTAAAVQADFENYRKRVLREQTALVERATEGLVEQLLPVLDSFELALAQPRRRRPTTRRCARASSSCTPSCVGVLERAGLERIDADGAPFDPNEHEAVLQDDGDGEPHVGETLRTGYRLKGRVLRPAMVKVTRKG